MESERDPSKRDDTQDDWEEPPEGWEEYFFDNYRAFAMALALGLLKRLYVDFFVPDTSASDDHMDTVFSLGWKFAAIAEKPEEIACMYASAMSAIVPDLEDVFLSSMKGDSIDAHRVFIPGEATARGIDVVLKEHEKYGPDEILVIFGTGLHILFKKITMMQEANYNRFVRKSLNALGSKLGMSAEALSRLKFPLNHKKACAVSIVFGYKSLNAKIIRYLKSACNQKSNLSIIASHMCEILSWSEMTAFLYIKVIFHDINSPVLQMTEVQHEVRAFYNAMTKVYKSEHPEFFYYFCSELDEIYVEKSNFPTLAEAARKCYLKHARASSSTEQSVAMPKASSPSGHDGSVGN